MGSVWEDWKETAEENGVSKELFERRIWDSRAFPRWTEEEAATVAKNQMRFRGEWLRIALKNGIKKKTYYGRVYDYGWTEEKAATTPVTGRGSVK